MKKVQRKSVLLHALHQVRYDAGSNPSKKPQRKKNWQTYRSRRSCKTTSTKPTCLLYLCTCRVRPSVFRREDARLRLCRRNYVCYKYAYCTLSHSFPFRPFNSLEKKTYKLTSSLWVHCVIPQKRRTTTKTYTLLHYIHSYFYIAHQVNM